MFQGAVALTLDAKGRMTVPQRHRELLCPDGAPLVLTAHPHRCVVLYPQSVWQPIRDEIVRMPGLDPRAAALKRLLVGFAEEQTLDGAGRVLLAPSLRQWAELEKNVWLVGQGSHLELWSETGWAKQQEAMRSISFADLPEPFQGLAL
ncbi:division/cell wall cluster transcriptional repressor MraZ [Hydrogenophilus thermoluteolus]|jgi:MraZ protein|uniref:Transcriptional regulator MraZ n=1 Tax=Hydrogenophilus thermoluteolus TaxID=297 RepID=A0A2Z6DX50_HYDTE|nr:division/cell wall cluster transcriptional repressor MraZ [Hydrogenophilus thermoluteolus]HCO78088.1 cell division/cell wall cluster transcriptional repressor MraZ [Rhodocyclaceae bacterium]MBW7656804.1 division/cell wall cluster transcriptional repressor MraZ [Hydrogenophilus thermoluteolus]BBD77030.1 cell division protein MraZ [Hydrogenophilus thermoluteolus]GLW60071.1 transcriptional regulator MraZ [Hydrogenophilus thermoluteolus]HNQ48751.1 division/cell wall cluster transcriptional repr